ncbi:hypothetical protein CAOG_05237 [Capsaspora owczarzaki ATCC 30864]|uniref:Uncharacterized protein n=1 Tax=Capsaspora owczarzaki (strain ATCC 30864) TaxID=595528 RepID=A0A0D2VTM8_CAPO3|nr:hypothetical protein CAOG_05237 [Capsaspora owczarzaki ATCC 30864]KJE94617.1 hypothetical protein CAOG_005237 [Capsaspora owczarzaki ATCC 30864]|eukprot:XP_004346922.1 hypothetical protein CAOG_05237 [Capsaspora owczarzaki ATCC 30864]
MATTSATLMVLDHRQGAVNGIAQSNHQLVDVQVTQSPVDLPATRQSKWVKSARFNAAQCAQGIKKVYECNLTPKERVLIQDEAVFLFFNGGKNTATGKNKRAVHCNNKKKCARWRDGYKYRKAHNTSTDGGMVYPPIDPNGLFKTLYQIDDDKVLVRYTKETPTVLAAKPATRTSPKACPSDRNSRASPVRPPTPVTESESEIEDSEDDDSIGGSDVPMCDSPASIVGSEVADMAVLAADDRRVRSPCHEMQSLPTATLTVPGLSGEPKEWDVATLRLAADAELHVRDFSHSDPSQFQNDVELDRPFLNHASTVGSEVSDETLNDPHFDLVRLVAPDLTDDNNIASCLYEFYCF